MCVRYDVRLSFRMTIGCLMYSVDWLALIDKELEVLVLRKYITFQFPLDLSGNTQLSRKPPLTATNPSGVSREHNALHNDEWGSAFSGLTNFVNEAKK